MKNVQTCLHNTASLAVDPFLVVEHFEGGVKRYYLRMAVYCGSCGVAFTFLDGLPGTHQGMSVALLEIEPAKLETDFDDKEPWKRRHLSVVH